MTVSVNEVASLSLSDWPSGLGLPPGTRTVTVTLDRGSPSLSLRDGDFLSI